MPDLITLTCPSCGAKLQIGENVNKFACAHCGNEHVVNRSGGIISLDPVVEELHGVRAGIDKTASELAIKRLKEEIQVIYRSMPSPNEKGCLEKLSYALFAIAMVACFWGGVGALDQELEYIIAGFITGAVAIGLGVWVLISSVNKQRARMKPYRDLIEQKTIEIEHHKRIVDGR